MFIATAAERTRHIRLGTGVISLPYHHPYMVANRMVLLDHLTRGRVMLGVGPGALASDAYMFGIDPKRQREMMDESLTVIMRLFTEEEPITYKSDWFELKDASIAIHETCGFRELGRRERIAILKGVWRDTVIMERRSQVVGV